MGATMPACVCNPADPLFDKPRRCRQRIVDEVINKPPNPYYDEIAAAFVNDIITQLAAWGVTDYALTVAE